MKLSSIRYMYRRWFLAALLLVGLCFVGFLFIGYEPEKVKGVNGPDYTSIEGTKDAYEIISVPFDSRPVTNEYLKLLVGMGLDSYRSIPERRNELDIFPYSEAVEKNQGNSGKLVDSKLVRLQLGSYVSQKNSINSTVILGGPAYFNGGMIGARSEVNYGEGINDLDQLTRKFTNPRYVVISVIPRAKPDQRAYRVWPDSKEKVRGVAYYYDLAMNKGVLRKTNPVQLLLEYGYLSDKMKNTSLEIWESNFIRAFDRDYLSNGKFKPYIDKYFSIYEKVYDQNIKLMKLVGSGQLDELVIGIDDVEAPSFYNSLPSHKVRYGVSVGIVKRLRDYQSSNFKSDKDNNISYIMGADELHQLVYAKDLSMRKKLTTDFKVFNYEDFDYDNTIGAYDALDFRSLLSERIKYVQGSSEGTKRPFYLFTYKNPGSKSASPLNFSHLVDGDGDFGLIEVSKNGRADGLDSLIENDELNNLSIYSSWNTQANAAGLGISHAQVFGIMSELLGREKFGSPKLVKSFSYHSGLLSTHIIEDGIYNSKIRTKYVSEKLERLLNSKDELKLKKQLVKSSPLDLLFGKTKGIEFAGRKLTWESYDIKEVRYPWLRRFDIYVEFQFEKIKKVSLKD